jgi:hypothetical protein
MHDMSRRSGERRSAGARRWAWIGGVAGALAVSGALLAVLYESGDSKPAADDASSDRPVEVAGELPGKPVKTRWEDTFDAAYGGPVWITVTSPDDRLREVTLTWGPWQRSFPHEGTEPVSYEFTKQANTSDLLTVDVEPEANVTFEQGTPPVGSKDVNEDWTEIGGG